MKTQIERIGQNLHDERERQGLSQAALEKIANVSRTTIQSIERGTWEAQRQGPTLRKLADALDLTIDDLRRADLQQARDARAFLISEAARRGVPVEQVARELTGK